VSIGVPVDESGGIVIPNTPTIMTVDKLVCRDDKHDGVMLSDVTALFGHGAWDTEREDWLMSGGVRVKDIVGAWSNFASSKDLPQIGFIISCNTQSENKFNPQFGDRLRAIFNKSLRQNLDQKDLRNRIIMSNFSGSVVESFGEIMRLYTPISRVENGTSVIIVDVAQGVFHGLDEAILAQNIKVL